MPTKQTLEAREESLAPSARRSILVVDDETTLLHVLSSLLADQGYEVGTAASAEEALDTLAERRFAVALFDIVLPRMNGLELLVEFKRRSPDTEVVVMTSQGSLGTAVEALRRGAYDYLQKPFEDLDVVARTLERAMEKHVLAEDNRRLLEERERRNAELTAAVARQSSLVDAGRALGELRSLPELLDLFIEIVARDLGASRASLMLLDPGSGELRIAASRGVGGFDLDTVRVRLGQEVSGTVAQSGRPVLVQDLSRDPRAGRLSSTDLANSFISVPITLGETEQERKKVLGVINVTNRELGRPFDQDDLAYLSGLAGQLAVAIEASRRFDELLAAYESLKIAQEQLLLSERKKAVAAMAAGVAHDFNNALAVILGRVELMLARLDRAKAADRGELVSDLETLRATARQAAERVTRLQHQGRPRAAQAGAAVDLAAVVREAVEITRPKWKADREAAGQPIEVELALAAVPAISGNPLELGQMLSNLIFNAVEAMPQGGRLSLRTRSGGDRVWLEVEDTGMGMTEETRRRLFDPFFTTKESGQGLGMAIVQAIAARHDGTIEVQSEEGRGSRFVIGFPPRSEEATLPSEPPRQASASTGAARVLLVDDELLVLETYGALIAAGGHEVTLARSSGEALSTLASQGFDVVVTDLSMPGMSGLELAKAARAGHPDLPVVLLSGWLLEEQEREVRAAGIAQVLAKPCSHVDLLATIERLAGGETQA